MIHGLVVTHGGTSRELVAVVASILGPDQGLADLSNAGKSARDLTAEVERWCDATLAEGDAALVFVDDMAGSCAVACRLVAARRRSLRILSGVNLAMLLDFTTWRESLDPDELARRLVEKGREAIALLPASGREG